MSTQTQSTTENAIDRIFDLIREIVERSGNGNCIYRGEPEHYDKVSSALYRLCPTDFDSGKYDLERLNKANLRDARNHIQDQEKDDFELLTELQHYGNQTNLIDFTTDYHIALFFACNGSHDKTGRVIVLQRSKNIDEKYSVKQPVKPINRVTAQKSIFTQPQKGYIEPNDFDTVTVPADLKQWILIYLWMSKDISPQSLYNDLYGFIQDNHLRQSPEANETLAWAKIRLKQIMNNDAPTEEKKSAWYGVIEGYKKKLEYLPYDPEFYMNQGKYYLYLDEYDCAIEACSKAILLYANYFDAYINRGLAYFSKKDYVGTIEDFDYIIEAYPEGAMAYIFRGIAALHQQDWEKAKLDFETGKEIDKEMGKFLTSLFRQDSQSVSDFEQKYNVKIPADIAEMLTPPKT